MNITPDNISDIAVTVQCPACDYIHAYGRHEFNTWPPTPGSKVRIRCKTHRSATPSERNWIYAISHITIQF